MQFLIVLIFQALRPMQKESSKYSMSEQKKCLDMRADVVVNNKTPADISDPQELITRAKDFK